MLIRDRVIVSTIIQNIPLTQYFGQSLGETHAYAQSPLGGPVRFAEQRSDAAIECLAQLHTDLVIPLDPLDETAIAMDRVSAGLHSQPA